MNLVIPHGFESNYVVGFARGLAANGVEFTVLSSDELASRLAAAGIAQRNIRGGQTLDRSVWEKATNLAYYYFVLLWTIGRHRGATIHFIGLLSSRIIFFDGLVLPFWLRLWAGRYIHTAHNALPHGRENSLLFRWAYRWIYRFPDVIVAHTEAVARQLMEEFGVDSSRITVISIGLNEEVPATTLSVTAARQHLRLPENGPIALFFGKVERYKGVDVLADAWGRLRNPDARLFIVGWCPDKAYADTVRAAIADCPRSATLEWREGFVPNDDVGIWLKACDVVVMPYRHIYQSGVIFLCLRFGVPIVATRVGSLAEYIDSSSGVFSFTNDAPGIADALDSFFERQKEFNRDKIAEKAARFGWPSQCAAIKHLYK
jgi:glycosyltransferase involved in cell wall biosynthesis